MQISPAEAFEAALNIEIEGEKFFLEMAKGVNNYKAKDIFAALAKEEREHVLKMQEIVDNLKGVRGDIDAYAVSEEVDGYIKAVMAIDIFKNTSVDNMISDIKDEKDALKVGIDVEKNTILFYSGLLDVVKDDKVRNIFLKILLEERKHLRILANNLEDIK